MLHSELRYVDFFKNKKALIIGHTGFKGYWLSLMLHRLGAELHGVSLPPPPNKPHPCPGLEYDRPGALFLQQTIAVEPGMTYRIGAEIRTVEVKGNACLHLDFFDSLGGSLYRVITEIPSGFER